MVAFEPHPSCTICHPPQTPEQVQAQSDAFVKMIEAAIAKGRGMTHSITLVNTSNWDGENYKITGVGPTEVTLRPGEKIEFVPNGEVTFEQADVEPTTPFITPGIGEDSGRRKDIQVTPKVMVYFGQ